MALLRFVARILKSWQLCQRDQLKFAIRKYAKQKERYDQICSYIKIVPLNENESNELKIHVSKGSDTYGDTHFKYLFADVHITKT